MEGKKLLYGRKEAAKMLSVGLRTLDQLVADRVLIPTPVRRRVLFTPEELNRFINSCRARRRSRAVLAAAAEGVA